MKTNLGSKIKKQFNIKLNITLKFPWNNKKNKKNKGLCLRKLYVAVKENC